MIGQLDEPFKVTLIYSSCLGENGATVALDSLELINCESGTLILFCFKQILYLSLFTCTKGAMLTID